VISHKFDKSSLKFNFSYRRLAFLDVIALLKA